LSLTSRKAQNKGKGKEEYLFHNRGAYVYQ